MTKLAIVVMTILFTHAATADDFQIKVKEDQQIIKIQDDQYNWAIDVDCNSKLKTDEQANVQVSKRRIQIGNTIKIKQGNKENRCRVKQLAVTSIF